MSTNDLVGLVGAFGLGSILTAIGAAWLNHFLSERRWEREHRSNEVTHWRNFSDRLSSLRYDFTRAKSLTVASKLPTDPDAVSRGQSEELERMKDEVADLDSGIRRSPEPLTAHVRLFNHRLSNAFGTVPPDQEYANFALMHFRQTLDEYVRRGKTSKPKLRPNESWPGDK